jgi:hypothetical protein
MFRTVRSRGSGMAALTLLLVAAATAAAQAPPASQRIVSSEIAISRDEAALRLELEDGRTASFAIQDGEVRIDGAVVGDARRGGALDRAWRDLLNRAIDEPTERLATLLGAWSPPEGEAGRALADGLSSALAGALRAPAAPGAPGAEPELSDSLARLVDRITQLQREVAELEQARSADRPRGRVAPPPRQRPGTIQRVWNGVEGVLSTLMVGVVLFGIGFAIVFFGGRRYIEGVADTARAATTRSLLAGMAALFLLVPAFVLGIIALAISIVGIPALLLWIPLFPAAAAAAMILGYLAVAHAAGEALAERRFYATDWFRRGNSYYFLMTGLGLLLSLFIAGNVVQMAGGLFNGLRMALHVVAFVVTMSALSVGLGAVLISRAGTRPIRSGLAAAEPEIFVEETHA